MPQKKLRPEVIKAVRKDRELRIEMMQLFGCNEATLYRYLRIESTRLVEYHTLELILKHLPECNSISELITETN